MTTVNVTAVSYSDDGYLTRRNTVNALITKDVYVFPAEQDYISITNNGTTDIIINVGNYDNIRIHTLQTWANNVDFTQFDVIATEKTTSFTYVTKEKETTPVTISGLWSLMAIRDKCLAGDMVLVTANATTSAGTINTAIAGVNKKYTKTVTFTLKTAADATHTWFNGVFPVAVTKVSTAGIISTAHAYITLVDGVGTIDVIMTGTWAQNDTVTVTVTGGTKYGYTIANKASVDTLGA